MIKYATLIYSMKQDLFRYLGEFYNKKINDVKLIIYNQYIKLVDKHKFQVF